MIGRSFVAFVVGILVMPGATRAQTSSYRLIISPEAPCREKPDSSTSVVARYRLGSVVEAYATYPNSDPGWFSTETSVPPRGTTSCWVSARASTPFVHSRPESSLLVLADNVLASKERLPLEVYVAAENVLIDDFAKALRTSGALQYRRLLLIREASQSIEGLAD